MVPPAEQAPEPPATRPSRGPPRPGGGAPPGPRRPSRPPSLRRRGPPGGCPVAAGASAPEVSPAEGPVIRRLPNVVLAGALAMLALLALPGSGRAQSHTMHFRPVSPESASSYERDARQG